MTSHGVLIEPQYLPSIAFFVLIRNFDRVIFECHEHYLKQSYRNRCRILTAQGLLELYIPVRHETKKTPMKDVRIDHTQKWVNQHWRSIISAYGKAPYFEHFRDYFHQVYWRKHVFLLDLNLELFSLCQRLLGSEPSFLKTSDYQTQPGANVKDRRSVVHPKKAWKYYSFYKPCNYNQIFGKKFVGNLSIIDLIFCEGPGAKLILENSRA